MACPAQAAFQMQGIVAKKDVSVLALSKEAMLVIVACQQACHYGLLLLPRLYKLHVSPMPDFEMLVCLPLGRIRRAEKVVEIGSHIGATTTFDLEECARDGRLMLGQTA